MLQMKSLSNNPYSYTLLKAFETSKSIVLGMFKLLILCIMIVKTSGVTFILSHSGGCFLLRFLLIIDSKNLLMILRRLMD